MMQIQCLDFTVRLQINCKDLGAEKRSVERKCPPTIYVGLSNRFDLGETLTRGLVVYTLEALTWVQLGGGKNPSLSEFPIPHEFVFSLAHLGSWWIKPNESGIFFVGLVDPSDLVLWLRSVCSKKISRWLVRAVWRDNGDLFHIIMDKAVWWLIDPLEPKEMIWMSMILRGFWFVFWNFRCHMKYHEHLLGGSRCQYVLCMS